MVALLDARPEPFGRRDREAHLDLAAGERARHLEAGVAKDGEHRRVVGKDLGDERLDAGLRGPRRQLLEHPCRCAASLELVRDRERDLRDSRVAQPRELGDGDDLLRAGPVGEDADERTAVVRVRLEEVLDECLIDVAHAVEAHVEAVLREPLEERDEGARITSSGRPQP